MTLMQVTCLGATRTVTGSCFLVENERLRFLVDCGMFQGGREIERRNYSLSRYRPQQLHYVLLTHAHIDHCGLFPVWLKKASGERSSAPRPPLTFAGSCSRTAPISRRWTRNGSPEKTPVRSKTGGTLYTLEDAEACLKYFEPVERNTDIPLSPDIRFRFRNAGHILGASFLEIFYQEQGGGEKSFFPATSAGRMP